MNLTMTASYPAQTAHMLLGVALLVILILAGLLISRPAQSSLNLTDAETTARTLIEQTSSADTTFVYDGIKAEHGLYVIDFHVESQGQSSPQQVYLSTDGYFLIPDPLVLTDVMAQLQAAAQAQQAAVEAPMDELEAAPSETPVDASVSDEPTT